LVAETYNENAKFGLFDSLIMNMWLRILNRFSKKDSGSSELLHFGCTVFAFKSR